MNKPKISVIMPVYNVERYVSKSIESIINQSFNDFELIIVNDGSTDNSKEIIEKYAKLDSRITIINKENEGVASARNLGIDRSIGKYLFFCDSDDYAEASRKIKIVSNSFFGDFEVIYL